MQNLACTYYGWRESRVRYSRVFHERLQWLRQSEHWPRERIESYQDEQLRLLIQHAYENVPFYRRIMQERRLVPDDIRSRDDLGKMPVLTKEAVRQYADAIRAQNANHGTLRASHTSGTTGKSLHFSTTDAARAFQWAVWWRHRARFGLALRDLHASFTGKLVVAPDQVRPPFWRWDLSRRQAILTMHHMTPQKIASVTDFLGGHGFVYYAGYPSVVHAMAACALEAGLSLRHKPRVVALGAENTFEFQRKQIVSLTEAVVTDQYGFSEGCGNASQCEEGSYHEDFEYGILECVDPEPVGDGRTRGRIVCTGFACPEFPFLRYEVGDVGVWEPEEYACPCGRESRVLHSIEGRQDDYVITPEGRQIMRFDYIFKDTDRVAESQVVQRELGGIVIRIVRRQGYGTADEDYIRSEVARWISDRLEVAFEYVDEIEREPNGKFRAVKSLLHAADTPPEQEASPHP